MENFVGYMQNLMNSGMLALMVSIGRQTGLFEVMSEIEASTSLQIAEHADLNERYVREWLGAMTTGKIIKYDEANKTYSLPSEHAKYLIKAAGPKNLARGTQYISLLAEVETQIVSCFQNGGGVSYSSYPRFHGIMAESSKERLESTLIEKIMPLSSFEDKLNEGINVLDIGCGEGVALILMAQAFPKSKFLGYDFSEKAIKTSQHASTSLGLSNISFEIKDLLDMHEKDEFDLITAFDAIHDQAQPGVVLSKVSQALKRGGLFFMMDIKASSQLHNNLNHPMGPFLYTVSTMHCMTVSLALDGKGLGTVWGKETAVQMLNEAGFEEIEVKEIEEDALNLFYIARRK